MQSKVLRQFLDGELVAEAAGGVLDGEEAFFPVAGFIAGDRLDPFDVRQVRAELRIVRVLGHVLGSVRSLQDRQFTCRRR